MRVVADCGNSSAKSRRSCGNSGKRFVNQFHDWLPKRPCLGPVRQGYPGQAMPLHLERIEWMPSPPLAPDDGPIDFEHLKRMTLGDAGLEHEVLAMFAAQSARLMATLVTVPADVGALVHTMKGSARAIGAFGVADAAARLEAVIAGGGDPTNLGAELGDTVALARAAIEAALRRS